MARRDRRRRCGDRRLLCSRRRRRRPLRPGGGAGRDRFLRHRHAGTLAKLERGDFEYLSPEIIPGYDVYLSFTGGPTLQHLERTTVAGARALYCSVDPEAYPPLDVPKRWDLSYLGTYSPIASRRWKSS
jgi:hypothetical protein